MSTSSSTASTRAAAPRPRSGAGTGSLVGRRLLLVLALGQPVSTVMFDLLSPTELTSGAEVSPIVPPGPMFAIWSLVIVASVAWSVLQVLPGRAGPGVRDRLVPPLAVTFAGFALWLAAASLGQSNALTLVVFVFIVASLVDAWRRASAARDEIAGWRRLDRVVLYLSLGTYTGWTSIAFFVNVSTVVQAAGGPTGADGVWWNALLLLAAVGTAVGIAVVSRGSGWYAGTTTYALVGAGISSGTFGFPLLVGLCILGVVLIVGSTVVIRLVDRARARSRAAVPA